MSEGAVVAAVLWLALTAYAVLAGADFGGGVWDLLATGKRATAQRRAVADAMGPVWEANHVWLIFMVTGLFTCFPVPFGMLALALYLPFTIALIGIVLRGAAFAFRAHGREAVGGATAWGVVFGAASIIAPVFMGMALAAVVSGSPERWLTPFGVLLGLLGASLCAYLAAAYLTVETEGTELESDFRLRAIGSGLVSGVLAIACLAAAPVAAPTLAGALFGRGLPLLVLALLNGPVALGAVWLSRPRIARIAVAAQVTFVLWAWAVGQWPYLIPPRVTIDMSAAPAATLTAWLIAVAAGMAVLLPSLYYLFRVFKGRNPAIL